MKALLSRRAGGPDTLTLEDIPEPVASAGEVRIRVRACGVNYPDLLIIQDLYQYKPPRPCSPGAELAGVVDSVGAGVTHVRTGDRVLISPVRNGMADKAVGSASNCWKIPDAMPFDEAAACLLTYATSPHALKDRARLLPGETLLVLGADDTVLYSTGSLDKGAALRAMGWEGRHLVIGFPAGIPKLPLNLPLLKSCQIVGVFWGEFTTRFPELHATNVAALMALYLEGRIKPAVTERFPLVRGGEAIARLGSRQARGKIIVTIGDAR